MWKPVGECVLQPCRLERRAELCQPVTKQPSHFYPHKLQCLDQAQISLSFFIFLFAFLFPFLYIFLFYFALGFFLDLFFPLCFTVCFYSFSLFPLSSILLSLIFPSFFKHGYIFSFLSSFLSCFLSFLSFCPVPSLMKTWSSAADNRSKFPYCP